MKKRCLIAIMSLLMVVSSTMGMFLLAGAAEKTETSNGDFFGAEGGYMSVTEDYTASATKGVRIDVSEVDPEAQTATIYYKDVIPVEELSNAITLQVLPSKDGEVDFEAMQFVFRDSKDPTQAVSAVIQIGNARGVWNTAGQAFLGDQFTRNTYGIAFFKTDKPEKQRIYGKDWFTGEGTDTDRYIEDGTLNLGTWETKFPYLAAEKKEETQAISVSYTGSTLSVNGRELADFKNDHYQALCQKNLDANNATDAAIIEKLNDEYVDSLFSSGKVTIEINFLQVTGGSFAVNIGSIGNTSLGTTYENNFTSTDATGQENTGTRFNLSSEALIMPEYIDVADLGQAITFQILPDAANTLACDYFSVILRDSADPTQLINIVIGRGESDGSLNTSGHVLLEEEFTRDIYGGTAFKTEGDTRHLVYGKDWLIGSGVDTDRYTDKGTLCVDTQGWGSHYAILGADEKTGGKTRTFSISYENSTVSVMSSGNDGPVVLAELNNKFYQDLNKNQLDAGDPAEKAIIDKLNNDYVNSLFSSGKVQVELRFYGNYAGKVNVISVGGQSAADLDMGGSASLKDTLAPEITVDADEENIPNGRYGTEYTVFSAVGTDAIDGNVTVTPKVFFDYNGTNQREISVNDNQFIPDAMGEYTIVYSAKDAAGNVAEKLIRVNVSDKKQITIDGVTATARAYDGTTSVQLTGGTLSGVLAGDQVQFVLGEGTLENANAGTDKKVTTQITLTGEDAANYELIQPENITVTIAKAEMDVADPTAAAGDLTYGDALPGLTGETTNGVYRWKEGQTLKAGTHDYEWEFVPTDSENYATISGVLQLTVKKAVIDVTAPTVEDGELVVGDEMPALKGQSEFGVYRWKEGQTLKAGTHEYEWEFVLNDTENYEATNSSGKIQLTVKEKAASEDNTDDNTGCSGTVGYSAVCVGGAAILLSAAAVVLLRKFKSK